MPPNRSCDNVDEVDELDGEGEGEIQTIRIVNSEKGGKAARLCVRSAVPS